MKTFFQAEQKLEEIIFCVIIKLLNVDIIKLKNL